MLAREMEKNYTRMCHELHLRLCFRASYLVNLDISIFKAGISFNIASRLHMQFEFCSLGRKQS